MPYPPPLFARSELGVPADTVPGSCPAPEPGERPAPAAAHGLCLSQSSAGLYPPSLFHSLPSRIGETRRNSTYVFQPCALFRLLLSPWLYKPLHGKTSALG